ncbi:MAG: hypothetical protein LBC49_04910 [Bacteroidales bacterium]|nr:hypothetical protein [Bacteroidales bacterium]
MEKIKDYFKRFPQSDECYEVDGRLFHTHGAAISFGSDVKKWTRAEVEKEIPSENKVDFLDVDLNSLTQRDLKKYADEFGLKTENNKKETLLPALLEKQAELKKAQEDDNDKENEE